MTAGMKQPRHTGAMWFDGVNDYVDVTNFLSGVPAFSVIATVTYFEKMNVRIVSARTGLTFFDFYIAAGGKLTLFDGVTFPAGLITIPYNTRTIVGVVFSSYTAYKTYVNGALDLTKPASLTWRNISLRIGGTLGYLKGTIRDVVIFGRALSDAEMVNPYAVTDSRLMALVGNGNTSANWQDTSGNGHHGTVFGSPESGCLVHRRGAVIRTDGNNNRYIVT